MNGCSKGIGVLRSELFRHGDVYFKGDPARKIEEPGHNAVVARACKQVDGGNVVAIDTGEHGVRITSALAIPGAGGIWGENVFTTARQGHLAIYRPGASGLKTDSGGGAVPIEGYSCSSLYVEDCGTSQFGPGATIGAGENHFGINMQNVRRFQCPSYTTKLVSNQHNGQNFILARQVAWVDIGTMQADGCYGAGIFWNPGAAVTNYFINIGGGVMSNFGRNGSAAGVQIHEPTNAGRVNINLDMTDGPQLIDLTGGGFTATPPSIWQFEITHFNVPITTFTGQPGARVRWDIRPATPPNSEATLDYGVGDIVFGEFQVGAGQAARRNAPVDVYIPSNSFHRYRITPAGTAPVESGVTFTRLPGAWRARGMSLDVGVAAVKVAP